MQEMYMYFLADILNLKVALSQLEQWNFEHYLLF
jgi:hypothetical protein